MIDINTIFDSVKLKFYYEWLVNCHIYDEGESDMHEKITKQVVETYIDPLDISKDAKILDLGCGPGYFLDFMKERGYTDLTGVTLSPNDVKLCESKGHTIKKYDLSFLPQKDGYYDESVNMIFLRHALEHSPFPIFSLMEYNRILKQNGILYIEVPCPGSDRKHEYNLNHYSILGDFQLAALLERTGFGIMKFDTIEFDVESSIIDPKTQKNSVFKERFYCILAVKQRPLDIK
jgi:SAM-dependent methyltransferase